MRAAVVFGVVLLVCSICTGQSSPKSAVSNDAASREQVLEFLRVMDMRGQFDALVPVMQQQLKKSFENMQDQFPGMDDEDVAFMTSEEQTMLSGLFKRIDIPKIEEAVVPIYQRHFTRPEMDAILVFYESPAGRKMRSELPAMMGEMMQVMNEQMQPIMSDLLAEMRQRMEQHIKMKKAKQQNSQR